MMSLGGTLRERIRDVPGALAERGDTLTQHGRSDLRLEGMLEVAVGDTPAVIGSALCNKHAEPSLSLILGNGDPGCLDWRRS